MNTMKNRFALALFFMFVSQALFSAHESCALVPESRQQLHLKNARVYDEQLTKQLQALFNKLDDFSEMTKLVYGGADPNLSRYGYGDDFLLEHAFLRSDVELVKACLTHGVRLDNKKRNGEMMNFHAITSMPILELLSKFGANFDHQNQVGYTALHKAIVGFYPIEIIEFFSCHVTPTHKEKTNTPLHGLCLVSKRVTDFAKRMALLLWWLPSQCDLLNDRERLAINYLSFYSLHSQFHVIREEMKRVHEVSFQQQNKENEKMVEVVQKFVPLVNLANLICSYCGPACVSSGWRQEEGNKKMNSMVEECIPVGDIAQLICSYSGPPYISLRSVIQTEENIRQECPEIAKLFVSTDT